MKFTFKTTLKHVNDEIDELKKDDVRLYRIIKIKKNTICAGVTNQKDIDYFYHSCRWVMHAIIDQQKKNELKLSNYVSLHSSYLKKIIGNGYKEVVENLLSKKIIICNNQSSSTTHQSYKFKINPKYKREIPEFYTLKEKKLTKKIKVYRDQELELMKERARPIVFLISWILDKPGLELNIGDASNCIDTIEMRIKHVLARYNLSSKQINAFQEDKITSYRKFLERWEEKKHNFHIDDSGQRLYNCLTYIPSILRNFVTYQGKTLIGLDIKNSQPFHFNVLLRRSFWRKDTPSDELNLFKISKSMYEQVVDVIPIIREVLQVDDHNKNVAREEIQKIFRKYQSLGIIKTNKEAPNNYMFPKNARTLVNKEIQTSNFSDLTTNGKLYNFILTYFPQKLPKNSQFKDLFATRSQAKRSFLHMMYHNPKVNRSDAKMVFRVFSDLFPKEAAIMMLLKYNYYKNFPVILQRIEAYLILRKVANEVRKLNNNIPLFTIHDSILTTEEHIETIRETMIDVYKKSLGVIPELKETVYKENNAFSEINDYIASKAHEKKFKKKIIVPHPLQKFIKN